MYSECMFISNQRESVMKKIIVLVLLALALLLSACTYDVACDPLDLIDKINKANQTPSSDTLELAQGCIYELSWIEDMTNGNNGLPVIGTDMIINGNGATIQRAENSDHFRIFQVGSKSNLSLNDLTIRKGYADGDENNYQSDRGGAILNFGFLTVNSSLITDNYAGFVGGIVNAGTANINRTTISHNNADSLTNGILNLGEGVMEIQNSTISENGLITFGDIILNIGTLNIVNSTISGNSGGIDNDSDSTGPGLLNLEYVTFSENSAAIGSASGTITIRNTLFGPHGYQACNVSTTLIKLGVNIDTDGSCNVTTVSPNSLKLGPLFNNGGKTRTHKLGQGSAAIDAATGQCPVNDQRGVHRPQNAACDVGSFENDDPVLQKAPEQKCKYVSLVNLFCRLGPSSNDYPETDSFIPGQESEVFGISPDGNFVQVIGPVNEQPCYVPIWEEFGELIGVCDDLPELEPPPTPMTTEGPGDAGEPKQGCTVLQDDGSLKCVSPCPAGVGPGDPCTIP